MPSGEGVNEFLEAALTEKLRKGWKVVRMTRDPSGDSVELVWNTSGSSRQFDAALYEKTQQAARQPLEEARIMIRALSLVLKWVGVGLLVGSCLLLIYIGAGWIGQLAVSATYP